MNHCGQSGRRAPSRDGAGCRRGRAWIALGAALAVAWMAAPAGAQQPVGAAVPDVTAPLARSNPAERAASASDEIWQGDTAASAVEAGFFTIGEGLYRRALSRAGLEAAERERLQLGLITALIAQGNTADATRELEAFTGPREGAWLVRRAAVDFQTHDLVALEARLKEVKPEELAAADAGWFHFLRAMEFYRPGDPARGDVARGDAALDEAINRATSLAERALFRLGQFQAKQLSVAEATDATAANLRAQIDRFSGQPLAWRFTLQYAFVLDQLGRKTEAQTLLTRQRDALPPNQGELRDQTLLLLGLIAGGNTAAGRDAFRRLVDTGTDREWQRAALLRLAVATPGESAGATELQQLFDRLLAKQPPHPMTEDLLFFRAELALRGKSFERAEQDANTLLDSFPGSDLRRNALALLASSSWQRKRYRTAADFLGQMRAEPLANDTRARLAVLLGECYYRAGMESGTAEDFRNAAAAYGIAQKEKPPGVPAGVLFFQRVLSHLRAGGAEDIDAAIALLDDPEARADADFESRWQAEWNLERMLQLAGRKDDAFQRVSTLAPAIGVPPELRLRFLWLAAQLTIQTNRQAETAGFADRVTAFLDGPDGASIGVELRADVASNAALLKAQARLDLGDIDGGIRAMEKIRADFPESRATVYSFIVQAHYLARENRLVDAQALLIRLADTYPKSEYAPLALYEAARLSEQRGQDQFLREASDILERLATTYPQDPLIFASRLKQADLARLRNQFPSAELIYRQLVNDYPNHPDRVVAELSLADAMMAQAGSDPSKFEGAVSRLERLFELPTAPGDLRAEAGCQLGLAYQSQGNAPRASEVFWQVYARFLGDAAHASTLGARGRYWVARSLVELGKIEEKAGRPEKARTSYEAVLAHGLPGASYARGRLDSLKAGG